MEAPRDQPWRNLEERLFAFALRIIRLSQKLQEKPGVGRTLSYQLLKAGTSVGANYEEGQAGQSRADFISKNSIALKEARETHYWLRLLSSAEVVAPELLADLIDEADQVMRILGKIVCRSRGQSE
jgi:four helix bundle protein